MTALPSLDDWQAAAPALGLKRHGREWVGPCPACGGTDRFRIGPRGFFCRQCCPDGKAGAGAMRQIVEAAGFDWPEAAEDGRRSAPRERGRVSGHRDPRRARAGDPGPNAGDSLGPRERSHGQSPTSAARETTPRPNSDDAVKIETARRIWGAAIPANGTPARRYLADRLAWPPDGIGPDLPAGVRWLPRERAPAADPAGEWYRLPAGAAGAVVYRLAAPRSVTAAAVSLEALDADATRLAKRWRRTFGALKGRLFTVAPIGKATGDVVICEGFVTALAAAWLYPGARCYATGGTAGMATIALPDPAPDEGARRIVIEADGDRRGDEAARAARDRLLGARVTWRHAGDAADELAAMVGERGAIMLESGTPADEATAAAWRDMLATHGRG